MCCTVLTGPMSIAHPSPNPDMKRPAIMTTLKASTFFMNHETPINVQPSKYGSSVMISVGLRPTISANEPATAPPNRAPIGAKGCKVFKYFKNNRVLTYSIKVSRFIIQKALITYDCRVL